MIALSLGAGAQSTTLALLAAENYPGVPAPEFAIFADTQWEPRDVYEHLDRLERVLPFPVIRVTAGNIRADVMSRSNTSGGRFASLPFHVKNADGTKGMGRRQCTREYKLDPIYKGLRARLGIAPRKRIARGTVDLMIGISLDEAVRMRDSREPWITNRYPLIDLSWRRSDCRRFLESRGWKVARSACLGCPFNSDSRWREIKSRPEDWKDVCEVDAAIRVPTRGFVGEMFSHASLKPLEEVDLRSDEELGQMSFLSECEGMCGV